MLLTLEVFHSIVYEVSICANFDVVAFQCKMNRVKCADGLRCISWYQICDGKSNCIDQSDESTAICDGKCENKIFRVKLSRSSHNVKNSTVVLICELSLKHF